MTPAVPTPQRQWKEADGIPQSITSQTARNVLMSRLVNSLWEWRLDEALSDLEQFLQNAPQDRECQLLRLVCNIKIHGLERYDIEIEKLKALSHLDCKEKQLLKYIFGLVIEQSKREGHDKKAATYQRLVRRLVRGSSIIDSDSTAEKIIDFVSVARARILRTLRLKRSVPRKGLGWRLAGLLGLLLLIVLSVQNNAGSPRDKIPSRVQAVHQDASVQRVFDVADLELALTAPTKEEQQAAAYPPENRVPIANEKNQEPSNDSKSSEPIAVSERKDSAITQASSSPRETQHRGHVPPKPTVRPAATEQVKPSSSQKLSLRESKTFPGHNLEPGSNNLPIYKVRVPIQVRKEVGFSAPVSETLAAGTEVSVVESGGDWFRVLINGTGEVGYVRREFLLPADKQ